MWLVVSPAGSPKLAHARRHRGGRAAPLRAPAHRTLRTPCRHPARGRRLAGGRAPLANGAVTDTIVGDARGHPAVVRRERLTVAPRYAEPDSASRARIDGELARAARSRARRTTRRGSGRGRSSARGRAGSPACTAPGASSTGGDQPAPRHRLRRRGGRAGPGRGPRRSWRWSRILLAGHAVYLDHGGGLVTGYFHLSRVDVAAGDTVAAGAADRRGGPERRVTGPHLHWIARYGAITVDPMSLFALPRSEPGDSGGCAAQPQPPAAPAARPSDRPSPCSASSPDPQKTPSAWSRRPESARPPPDARPALRRPSRERALVAHLHQAEPLRHGLGLVARSLGQLGVHPLRGLVADDAVAHERTSAGQSRRPRPERRRSR